MKSIRREIINFFSLSFENLNTDDVENQSFWFEYFFFFF